MERKWKESGRRKRRRRKKEEFSPLQGGNKTLSFKSKTKITNLNRAQNSHGRVALVPRQGPRVAGSVVSGNSWPLRADCIGNSRAQYRGRKKIADLFFFFFFSRSPSDDGSLNLDDGSPSSSLDLDGGSLSLNLDRDASSLNLDHELFKGSLSLNRNLERELFKASLELELASGLNPASSSQPRPGVLSQPPPRALRWLSLDLHRELFKASRDLIRAFSLKRNRLSQPRLLSTPNPPPPKKKKKLKGKRLDAAAGVRPRPAPAASDLRPPGVDQGRPGGGRRGRRRPDDAGDVSCVFFVMFGFFFSLSHNQKIEKNPNFFLHSTLKPTGGHIIKIITTTTTTESRLPPAPGPPSAPRPPARSPASPSRTPCSPSSTKRSKRPG